MTTTKAKRKTYKPKTPAMWTREVKSATKAVSNAEKKIKAARRLVKKHMAAKKAAAKKLTAKKKTLLKAKARILKAKKIAAPKAAAKKKVTAKKRTVAKKRTTTKRKIAKKRTVARKRRARRRGLPPASRRLRGAARSPSGSSGVRRLRCARPLNPRADSQPSGPATLSGPDLLMEERCGGPRRASHAKIDPAN